VRQSVDEATGNCAQDWSLQGEPLARVRSGAPGPARTTIGRMTRKRPDDGSAQTLAVRHEPELKGDCRPGRPVSEHFPTPVPVSRALFPTPTPDSES